MQPTRLRLGRSERGHSTALEPPTPTLRCADVAGSETMRTTTLAQAPSEGAAPSPWREKMPGSPNGTCERRNSSATGGEPRVPCSVTVHPWAGDEGEHGRQVVKADHQKADDAEVPRELWDRFLWRTFMERFGRDGHEGRGWRSVPAGCKEALDVIRIGCLRRWRVNLLRSFARWRQRHYPLTVSANRQPWVRYWPEGYLWRTSGSMRPRPRPPGRKKGRYIWDPLGRRIYLAQIAGVWKKPGAKASFTVARDGLRRAAGPYNGDDNRHLRCWWEWVSGSTPFFWNWPNTRVRCETASPTS